jgi:GNAT superfamily N-acetyltransferase
MAEENYNYERLIALANNVFETKNDPNQLNVNQEVIEKLEAIHPSCLSEFDEGDGPVSWVLIFPTSNSLRDKFLNNEITEKELFDLTEIGIKYEAIYLCSALVLEEYRRKGIAKLLSLNAIKKIQKDHKITSLFYWAFTEEGRWAAESISKSLGLELKERIEL